MKKLVLCLCIFALNSIASATDENQRDQYYLKLFTGQHRTQNYQGPLYPLTRFNSEKGHLVFVDDMYKDRILQKEIQSELFVLKDFWFDKLNDQSTCPDTTLSENLDYIRYLYRLTTMSYLFESLRINHRVTTQLGSDTKICSISYDDIFGKCHPKSSDMKKFKERVYGKFVNEFSKVSYDKLFKSEIAAWLKLFKRSSVDTLDPTFSRLHSWCKNANRDCDSLTIGEIKSIVGDFCIQDRQLIRTICDENDALYGMSYIEKTSELVKMSYAFNLINSNGMGENCLRRFQKVFTPKEYYDSDLARLYPIIYAYLTKENSRYLQGELFLPGALKEFDNKGLSDFLTALKPPAEPVAAVAPKLKPTPTPTAKPIVVAEVKTVEVKPEPQLVAVAEVPAVHVSEFERAVITLQEKNLDRIDLDMDIFQNDFEFTTKMISELSIPLRKFQTRKALNEMKTFDKLGTKEAPLGLIFLKFLIDTENHQGLYNVIAELSNTFYVQNDLEDKNIPVYIELKNDSSTKNKWQLTILKPQKNSGADKK